MRRLVPIFLNQATAVVIAVAGLKAVSKWVPMALNKPYPIFVNLTQIAYFVTHSGLSNHAVRYWRRESKQQGTYARFLWAHSWRRLWLLIILLLGAWIVVAREHDELNWGWFIFVLVVAGNIAVALQMTAQNLLQITGRNWELLGFNLLTGIARVALPILCAVTVALNLRWMAIGYGLYGLLTVGLILWLFRKNIGAPQPSERSAARWDAEVRDFGRPFFWLGAGGWMLLFADSWVVLHFFGDQSGSFNYASRIGQTISGLVLGGLMQVMAPEVYRLADRATSSADWKRIANRCDLATAAFAVVTLAGLGLFRMVGYYLVPRLIAPQYADSILMVLPAGLAAVTLQINQFYGLFLQGQHNSAGMVKLTLAVAAAKTAGSIVAASISWNAFIGWMIAAPLLSCLAGRWVFGKAHDSALGLSEPA